MTEIKLILNGKSQKNLKTGCNIAVEDDKILTEIWKCFCVTKVNVSYTSERNCHFGWFLQQNFQMV